MKNIFERKEIAGIQYNVIVNTKFGSTLSTSSGDNVFHTTPLLKTGIEDINSYRDKSNLPAGRQGTKLSNKRRR